MEKDQVFDRPAPRFATQPSNGTVSIASAPAAAAAAAAAAPRAERRRRGRGWLIAVLLLLLAIGGAAFAGGYLAAGPGKQGTVPGILNMDQAEATTGLLSVGLTLEVAGGCSCGLGHGTVGAGGGRFLFGTGRFCHGVRLRAGWLGHAFVFRRRLGEPTFFVFGFGQAAFAAAVFVHGAARAHGWQLFVGFDRHHGGGALVAGDSDRGEQDRRQQRNTQLPQQVAGGHILVALAVQCLDQPGHGPAITRGADGGQRTGD